MSLYRIYIDEVGNHDLTHADDPNPDKPEPNRVKNCYIKQKEYTTVAGFSVFIAKSILDTPKEP
ncbi:MAG: hypothetical protein AB1801_17015, partial [Chloroflexota bacterium]